MAGVRSFEEFIKIIRFDPDVGEQQVLGSHQFHKGRVDVALVEGQSFPFFSVKVPEAQFLFVGEDELFVIDFQDLVVGDFLVFFFLHDKVELLVVDQDGGFFLHDDVVLEGIDEGDSDF